MYYLCLKELEISDRKFKKGKKYKMTIEPDYVDSGVKYTLGRLYVNEPFSRDHVYLRFKDVEEFYKHFTSTSKV